MDKTLKVLLLVAEPWRSDDSGGNSLNNFLEGMSGVEFAQIYTDNQMPENNVCNLYYQIPKNQIFSNILNHHKIGHVLTQQMIMENRTKLKESDSNESNASSKLKNLFIKWLKNIRPELPGLVFTSLMLYSNWKTDELNDFIDSFNADVIYAPCYASPFHLALTRYVKQRTGLKIITWSADDCYSLKQFSLNPFFWIKRFWNRHCLRKTYPCYDEFYSISEEEAVEMEPVVGKKIGIIRKGVVVPEVFTPREIHKPIRFIYAGGLYLNRHKSLIRIAQTLKKLNKDGVKAELHIYSGNQLDNKSSAILNDGISSFMHGLISPVELSAKYKESDVAIHCESFDLKYRLMTRLSFSTKIIDCFQSGCAILAIAWKEHTGIKCLKREDAAICVTNVNEIDTVVTNIVYNPEIIYEYAAKAYYCEKRNHRIEDVHKKLYDSFLRCAK